jgi:DNA-binding SARP family transcriptional activator
MNALPSAPLRLQLLGSFEVTFHGEPCEVSQPGQRLLAYLAVAHRGRAVRRGALAERLWPDVSPARAASSLRSVLWRLPRPRGRVLVTSTVTTVKLNDAVGVDLWDAEEQARLLATAECTAHATGDLTSLTRDLLPDWEQDWLVVEQESYRQKRLHALERAAKLLCERGDFTQALSAGFGAVQSEPLRESAHRRVIEVHLAEGNHAEALRQYHVYRRLLSTELGLAPSPTIRTLVAPLLGRPAETRGPYERRRRTTS